MDFAKYKALLSERTKLINDISALPCGYISKKTISGKTYFYRQSRVNGKVLSEYIKDAELSKTSKEIEKRNHYQSCLKEVDAQIAAFKKQAAIAKDGSSRILLAIEICADMDSMDLEQRMRSVSFAQAMNAIEGVSASNTLKENMEAWCKGEKPFSSVYAEALAKYGLSIGGILA